MTATPSAFSQPLVDGLCQQLRLIHNGSMRLECSVFNATEIVADNKRSYHVKVALFRKQNNREFKKNKKERSIK
jgi:hypothetical protein